MKKFQKYLRKTRRPKLTHFRQITKTNGTNLMKLEIVKTLEKQKNDLKEKDLLNQQKIFEKTGISDNKYLSRQVNNIRKKTQAVIITERRKRKRKLRVYEEKENMLST